MHSILLTFAAAGLASVAQAFTKPGEATWGALLTPDLTHPVTAGEDFEVTWDPSGHETDGVTVSLVLCHGPSSNCVPSDTAIVEGLPAAQKSYQWSVPSGLAPGKQSTDTGYGMLIIVDGTGEFQYSTQFSVLSGKGSSASSSTSVKPTASTDSSGSIILGPPAQQTGSSGWGTSTASPNGTVASNGSGSWGSTTATGATSTYTDGGSFTFDGTTYASTLATQTSGQPGTTAAAGGSSTTASAPANSASTFAGAADHLSLNAAGLAVAGVVAIFAL
ncbi:uncharacterized protein A1O9_12274 [Exophiala aquamarina CBS 119918]|uniref:Yeast cell wall synthesis Kre9/Knh1-like N-terminal domain-containing protein n=1 Tax=Exophiala aquamarina CBS 119918 TaxID=1182545 RepID=A0A072NUT3_9EURO|nr:uncharacterized protein A1O9_12274 [Exophiala aquamarina CBS 119918]KEF51639.1 hypothetical protein A1O9_12274 [Exophiala aquamarina CBS 119918]